MLEAVVDYYLKIIDITQRELFNLSKHNRKEKIEIPYVVASLTRLSSIRKNRSAGVSNRRHYFFISETDCFRYNLWNIQHIMDKPSLSRDHNGKCANSKEKYFSHSIDTAGLKLLFQIGRQDS